MLCGAACSWPQRQALCHFICCTCSATSGRSLWECESLEVGETISHIAGKSVCRHPTACCCAMQDRLRELSGAAEIVTVLMGSAFLEACCQVLLPSAKLHEAPDRHQPLAAFRTAAPGTGSSRFYHLYDDILGRKSLTSQRACWCWVLVLVSRFNWMRRRIHVQHQKTGRPAF